MSYFSKEQYLGKALYAAKVNMDNKKILLDAGLSEDEIELLIELSHTRHDLHSASSSSDKLRELYDTIGHQYSADITLIDEVNAIANKYGLPTIPAQEIPEIDIDDDHKLIADYFAVSVEEVDKDYEESIGEFHQDILLEWEKSKDKTSKDIRVFFYYINKKYGTDFPDNVPEECIKKGRNK